jgi:hypothetical protein
LYRGWDGEFVDLFNDFGIPLQLIQTASYPYFIKACNPLQTKNEEARHPSTMIWPAFDAGK